MRIHPSTKVYRTAGKGIGNKNARQYDVGAARSLSVPTFQARVLLYGLENAADCQLEKPGGLGFSISHRPKGAIRRGGRDVRRRVVGEDRGGQVSPLPPNRKEGGREAMVARLGGRKNSRDGRGPMVSG